MVYTKRIATEPAVEPITLAEVKNLCRVTHDEEDGTLETIIIPAARRHTERMLNRQLITATWDVYLDEFPECREIALPLGRLQSVSTFEFTDSANTTTAWSVSSTDLVYSGVTQAHIDEVAEPARIRLAYGLWWPSVVLKTVNPIHIRYDCGYGDDASDVPTDLRHAILMLCGHLYKHRESVIVGKTVAIDAKSLPRAYEALLAPYRLFSFG